MMVTLVGGPFETARDSLAQWVKQNPALHALGLPSERSVFQADTAESPEAKPFVVLRWGDEETRVGNSWKRPVDAWVYDEFGDYNRASNIAKAIGELAQEEIVALASQGGWITQVKNLGVGGDLADDGFDALVVPVRLMVVGSGL